MCVRVGGGGVEDIQEHLREGGVGGLVDEVGAVLGEGGNAGFVERGEAVGVLEGGGIWEFGAGEL